MPECLRSVSGSQVNRGQRHSRMFLAGIQVDRDAGFPPKARGNDTGGRQARTRVISDGALTYDVSGPVVKSEWQNGRAVVFTNILNNLLPGEKG